jgi:hypothetical protein
VTHIYIKPSSNQRFSYLTRSVRRRAATSKRANRTSSADQRMHLYGKATYQMG